MRANTLLLLSLMLVLQPVAFAQDDADPDDSESQPTEQPADEAEEEVLETDDESYIDIDEEDFIPTEEIPTDQSIPFPTDI